MDPLTALGLAGNIVDFVEYAAKLVSRAREINASATGTLTTHADMTHVIEDVQAMTRRFCITEPVTEDDVALQDLVKRCRELSEDLVMMLGDLQSRNPKSKTESLRVAWRTMRKKEKVESLEKRIERYRRQILDRILIMMSEETSAVHGFLKETTRDNAMLSSQSRKDLRDLMHHVLEEVESLRTERTDHTTKLSLDMQSVLSRMCQLPATIDKEDYVMERLQFEEMHNREFSIEEAHEKTFRWLLYSPSDKDPADQLRDAKPEQAEPDLVNLDGDPHGPSAMLESDKRKQTRLAYLRWLNSGHGVFHISGKPGSGKSTLMKFLGSDKRTLLELEAWAGEKKLIFAQFFFWSSGSPIQGSLEGLYRSILWGIIRAYPNLIKHIFPRIWQDDNFKRERRMPFGSAELTAAFEILTSSKEIFENHKVCLFIDGLDEYSGDHWKLAQGLKAWSDRDFKMCVSSRPHNEYIQTFTDPCKRFRLHELTEEDIWRYVDAEFQNDERFVRACERDARYSRLIESLIEKADGVFLWVRLVTRELLGGIGNNYSIAQLEDELNQLPVGLEALFRKMLTTIRKPDRIRAARNFLVHLSPHTFRGVPRLSIVHAAMDELFDGNLNEPLLLTRDKLQDMELTIEERLNSRCKGFFQSNNERGFPNNELRYSKVIHRTVFEFLSLDDVKKELVSLSGMSDSGKTICNALLLLLSSSHLLQSTEYQAERATHETDMPTEVVYYEWAAEVTFGSFFWILESIALPIIAVTADSDMNQTTSLEAIEMAYTHIQRLSSLLRPSLPPEGVLLGLHLGNNIIGFRVTSSSDDLEGQKRTWIALCCLYNLASFILERHEFSELLRPTVRTNLLLLASIGCLDTGSRFSTGIYLVKSLLGRGVSPNWTMPDANALSASPIFPRYSLPSNQTTWKTLLQLIVITVKGRPADFIQKACSVMEHYLDCGADPTVLFVGYQIEHIDTENVLSGPYYFDFAQLLDVWEPPNKHRLSQALDLQQGSVWNKASKIVTSIWQRERIPVTRIETECLRSADFIVYRVITRDELHNLEGLKSEDVASDGLLQSLNKRMTLWVMAI